MRRMHETLNSQKVAGVDPEVFALARPGDRVSTVDGPGTVADVYDGPFPQTESYYIVLDDGVGEGEYARNQILGPLIEARARRYSQVPMACDVCGAPASSSKSGGRDGHTMLCPDCIKEQERAKNASREEAARRTAARADLPLLAPEELKGRGAHTAADDYPELAEVLWERPDLVESVPVEIMPRRMSLGAKTAGSIEPVWLKERKSNPIKDSLNDKNQPFWWRKVVGPALDRYNDSVPSGRQIKDYEDVNRIDSPSWCRFRRKGTCYFPKDFDERGSEEAGYAVWIPFNRGECPWKTWNAQRSDCKVSEPGPKSGESVFYPDATISWSQGGQQMSSLSQPVELISKHESAWVDVREKAKRIRSSGGVRIISALEGSVTGEIKGDTGLYTSTITVVPGTNQVALATCSCPWETYRWARSGPWKKLEGRACAHITALLYEMQSRKMFGGEITEDAATPEWRTEEPTLENPKSQPGPWRLDVAASVQRHLRVITAQRDSMEARAAATPALDEQALSLGLAVANLGDGQDSVVSLASLVEARSLIDVAPFYAQVNGELVVIDGFDEDGNAWSNGRPISRRQLMYPTFHPTRGITGSLKTAAHSGCMVALVPSPELAAAISVAAESIGIAAEPAEEIHLTVAYAGKAADIDRATFMAAVQGIAALSTPLTGKLSGWGTFANGDENVLWASVSLPGLDELRMDVRVGLDAAGISVANDKGFTPHITAGYTDEPITSLPVDDGLAGSPLVFDAIVAAYAGEWVYFDLTSPTGEAVIDEMKAEASVKVAKAPPGAEGLQAVLDAQEEPGITHAGLVIKAADSGRVLMTQRTPYHGDDEDTYGKWEFPGGSIDEGETALQAALREFREETGLELPEGHRFEGVTRNDAYLGIIVSVSNEAWTTKASLLPMETMGIGWFHPDHVEETPITRPEVDDTDWDSVKEASSRLAVSDQEAIAVATAEHYRGEVEAPARGCCCDAPGCRCASQQWEFEASLDVEAEVEAILHDEPQPALPEALGAMDAMEPDLFGAQVVSPSSVSTRNGPEDEYEEPSEPPMVDPVGVTAGIDPRVAWLMDEPSSGGDADIATAAKAALAKMALKTFSIEEQHELIHEGAEDHRGARNTDRLSIAGTHYEYGDMGSEDESELLW